MLSALRQIEANKKTSPTSTWRRDGGADGFLPPNPLDETEEEDEEAGDGGKGVEVAETIDIKGVGASLLDELVLDVNAVVMMGGDVGGVVLDAGDDLHRGEGAAAGEEEKEKKREENHRC